MKTKHVVNFVSVKAIKDNSLTAVASNATIDRDGESILPTAFLNHLDLFRGNPVILANHTHRSLDGFPTIIGSADRIEVKDDALEFDMTFATTPLAQQWQSLFTEKHAKAFSVGFIPVNGELKEIDDHSVYVHTEVELLEISAVGVPSNPDALRKVGSPVFP